MNHRNLIKFVGVIALLFVLLVSIATPALAAGVQTDDVLVISNDVDDDLYAIAQNFTLSATVHGDLIVFARTITITPNGAVEGDLLGAGQDIIIQGEVKGDVRMAGAMLMVTATGNVHEDLIGAGYSLELEPGSPVGGDVIFAGSQAAFSGSIAGDVQLAGEGMTLNGSVDGKMKVYVGKQDAERFNLETIPGLGEVDTIPAGLSFGPQAKVGESFEYYSPQTYNIPESVIPSDKVTYHAEDFRWEREIPAREESTATKVGNWFLNKARWIGTLLLVGLLLAWVTPDLVRKSAEHLQEKPLHSLGWGFVSIFALVFALLSLVVVVTMLGLLLGILQLGGLLALDILVGLMALFGLVLVYVVAAVLVSKVIVSYLVGVLILKSLKPEWAKSRIWPLALGLLIYVLITAIPYFLGGFIDLVVTLLGLGALWLAGSQWLRRKPARPEENASS